MRRSRILIALIMAAVSLIGYCSLRQVNPFTGQVQHISLNTDQEVALGIQMTPEMTQEMGGLDPDPDARALVTTVGERVVRQSGAGQTPYEFRFYALGDQETVNAFALPGGPVFITRALLGRLENEAQLAGVLGHEVGHVVARHSAEQIAQSQLAQGLVGAAGVAGSDDNGSGQQSAQVAAAVAQMVQLRYGRKDEIQADTLGVRMMADAGYDPRALIEVMRILEESSGGGGQPEFMSSHPNPGNRREIISAAIERLYPGGSVPASLTLGRTFTPVPRSSSVPGESAP
jgi:predicted Zn-dependent protease